MRENTAKGKPIPGFPMNQKAEDSGRYYSKDDTEVLDLMLHTVPLAPAAATCLSRALTIYY